VNRFGPLFEDRPHVFKVFTSYAVTSRVTASGFLRVQSGAPWAARARDWEGGVLNYLEPAGSHRNPTWTNLDLMGSYKLPLNGTTRMSFEARLLNVFNNQTQLSTDSQQFLDLRTIPNPPYFAPYLQPNPFFATGNLFAPPRRLYLAAVVSF
jgi:TonB dependent receptor